METQVVLLSGFLQVKIVHDIYVHKNHTILDKYSCFPHISLSF